MQGSARASATAVDSADLSVALFAGALAGGVLLSLAVAAAPDKRTPEDSKPRIAIGVETVAVEFQGSNEDLDLANISDQIARIEKLLAKTVENCSHSNHCHPIDIEAQQVGCVNFATSEHLLDQDGQQAVQKMRDDLAKDWESLLILGSADTCGPSAGNLNLSKLRAQSLANEILHGDFPNPTPPVYFFGLGEAVGEAGKCCEAQQDRSACAFGVQSRRRFTSRSKGDAD